MAREGKVSSSTYYQAEDKKLKINYLRNIQTTLTTFFSIQNITTRTFVLITIIFFCSTTSLSKNLVLCYHKIGYSLEDIYTVSPEMFEKQLRLIDDLEIKIVGIDSLTNLSTVPSFTVSITFDDGWKIPQRIIKLLRNKNTRATFFIYPLVIGGKGFFSWKDLANLTKDGFIIGSHSYSHKFLKGLSNDVLLREIVSSKKLIEEKINEEVFAFAYPFGIADGSAYSLASKTYKISFVVNDRPITKSAKMYKLPRYIVFNHTTLGQFREIVDSIYECMNLDYKVYHIESQVKGLYAKLYHYPVTHPEASVLVIPSMSVGPAWFKTAIDKFREFNIEVWVFTSEIYSFPFYKYEVYYDRIKDFSLENVSMSLKKTINLLGSREIKIVTWGDGLELLLYLLETSKFTNISKIIVINPFLRGVKSYKEIKLNISAYKTMITKGKYDFESFRENVKTSVLLNLAFLMPKDQTPFEKEFGNLDNTQALLLHINKNLNLRFSKTEYPIDEYINKIQFSPFYPFSVIEPISYYLGINQFWLRLLKKTSLDIPKTVVFYNSEYKDNYAILSNLTKLESEFHELSTVEIFVSDWIIGRMIKEIRE
ncbi:MAG: polysaccharide deacetylase family protein [Brevinematia bacterium]